MTKVTMGAVWDRTSEVLSGRFGALAGIAFLTLFLPLTILLVWTTSVAARVPGAAAGAISILVLLLVVVAAALGALAMIALASDPATTRAEAWALARARLLPLLAVVGILVVVAIVLLLPIIGVLTAAHVDMARLAAGASAGAAPAMSRGVVTFLALYYLAFLILMIWASARLSVLNAVVLHERLGLGAIRRSIALTRGLTWRLIGVLFLYVIVLFVVRLAAQSVVGVVLRLALGPANIPTVGIVVALVGAAVTTVFSIIAVAFSAQLYVALVARHSAPA